MPKVDEAKLDQIHALITRNGEWPPEGIYERAVHKALLALPELVRLARIGLAEEERREAWRHDTHTPDTDEKRATLRARGWVDRGDGTYVRTTRIGGFHPEPSHDRT
jgi:hypothetical protein